MISASFNLIGSGALSVFIEVFALLSATIPKKKVLICAMKEKEAPIFQQKVVEIDANAFVIFAESQKILGNGFYIYH